MILLKRSTAVVLYVLFTVSIVAIGIYAYLELGGEPPETRLELKAKAESILYISLTGAVVILIAFITVSWRTLSLYRELDKLIELNKREDFSPELSMKKLGPIGERITLLYYSLNTLNERKTLKISGLSSLADFLMDNIDIPLLATDVQGYIRYSSRSLVESMELPRAELIGKNAEELFPDVPFRESVLELDRRNSSVELKELKDPVTLAAIRNRRSELSYVVWLFGGAVRLPESPSRTERIKGRRDRRRRVFKRRPG